MNFRKALFWLHLVAGVISGLSIAIMCFTGTMLAFEKELVAWSERSARRIETPPPGTSPLSIDELQAAVRASFPNARPMSIVFHNNPGAAVAFPTGRTGGFYVNPYTGEVRQPAGSAMSDFMRTMTEWHRYLGFSGEASRPRGKLINGVCNLAFFVLAVTGLYLWMPRKWAWRALRPVVWFRQNASAKARDFNWHNVIGFWTAPVLIVLTLTAVPISFQWGGNLIFTLTGTPAPATTGGGPGGPGAGSLGGGAPVAITAPSRDAKPLRVDELLATVKTQVPAWSTITLRLGNAGEGRREGGGRPGGAGARSGENTPAGDDSRERRGNASTQALTFTVRESTSWPRTATTTVAMNPYTGEIVRRSGYADLNSAQQVRSWTRFLHTGEALGWPGQLVAGLACLGGVFLVYTGFALTWRRFFGPRSPVQRRSPPLSKSPAGTASLEEPELVGREN